MTKQKQSKHYVINEAFHAALLEWHTVLKDNPDTRMPEFIGDCIDKIAQHVVRMPRFNRYQAEIKENCVSDARLVLFTYIKKFDPTAWHNPFAYFTTAAYRAMLQSVERHFKKRNRDKEFGYYHAIPYVEGQDNKGLVDVESYRSYRDNIAYVVEPEQPDDDSKFKEEDAKYQLDEETINEIKELLE